MSGNGDGPSNRRQVLKALGASVAMAGLAGCDSDSGGTPSETPTPTPTPVPTDCQSYTTLTQSDLNGGATLSEGCYRIEQTHTVDSGTLTLEAGVFVEFAADAGLEIRDGGNVMAQGTDSKPVVLTGQSESRGFWKGVRLNGTGNANVLEHTVIRYAGSENWSGGNDYTQAGLYVVDSVLELRDSTVRENGNWGLAAVRNNVDLTVTDTAFVSNENPARVHGDNVGGFASDVTVRDNDTDRIRVQGRGSLDPVSTAQTWVDTGVDYFVNQDLALKEHVTIESGTTMVFAEDVGLDVNEGALTVNGTSSDLVRFEGDENRRGYWAGIRFVNTDSSDNHLEYAYVQDAGATGGGAGWTGSSESRGGIWIQGDDVAVTFQTCWFLTNEVAGLAAESSGADLTVDDCKFADNAVPLKLHANLVGGVAGNQSFVNSQSYVDVGDLGATVKDDATWPAHSIPYRITTHRHNTDNVRVAADLELEPGMTVEFAEGTGIRVVNNGNNGPRGSLTADGSGTSKAFVFRGVEEEKGFWRGIAFNSGTEGVVDNVLRDVIIEHAGGYQWSGSWDSKASLWVWGGSIGGHVTIEDSEINETANYHMGSGGGTISCHDVTFDGSDQGNHLNTSCSNSS